MRGTPTDVQCSLATKRFIPAYAGNALAHKFRPPRSPVHPRVCGERNLPPLDASTGGGSSPRMRGTLQINHPLSSAIRFIPAYAGNAAQGRKPYRQKSVHPRVCGERTLATAFRTLTFGSSPRMRGTQGLQGRKNEPSRFIPAYAGNASRDHHSVLEHPVHPRVCGERGKNVLLAIHCIGSSPRMRGTRRYATERALACRFIPAYAGNAMPPSA